jgi:sodium-dependent dicarboxylate transporter 2/3/5
MNAKRLLKRAILLGGVLGFGALLLAPTFVVPVDPETGTPYHELPTDHPEYVPPGAAQKALGVFVLAFSMWVTAPIPLPATSILAIALLPALGIVSPATAYSYFGNGATLFLLGVFILAAAIIDTGLSKRITLLFLHRFDSSPKRLIGGVIVTGTVMSLVMPSHAVAAMMLPILIEIAEALKLKRSGSPYARSLFLALAWGTVVGGVGTFLGGGRAVLACDLLRRAYPDADVPTFLGWAERTMPLVFLLAGVVYLALTVRRRFEIDSVAPATHLLSERVSHLGPFGRKERRLVILMVATVASWMFLPELSDRLLGPAHRLGVAGIALLAAVAVFAFRIAGWPRLEGYVNWGILVMYGGAVALGEAVARTHAADWFAMEVIPTQVGAFAGLVVVAALSMALTEGISNAAVVALLVPMGFGLCDLTGWSPVIVVYMVAVPAGLAFNMPMSSPPCAIAYSAGYYGVGQVIKRGAVVSVVALGLFLLLVRFYWPLVGLKP